MANECAQCQRMNNDDATGCLYCGHGLTPREPAPAGRRTNPYHLAWLSSGNEDADAASLAELLKIDSFRARLLARSAVPRILRTHGDATTARQLHASAVQLGLRTFLVDEHTLETYPPIESVQEARLERDELRLTTSAEDFLVPPDALTLIVTSRIAIHRVRTSARISMLPSGTGSGAGLPRMVKETQRSGSHIAVLDLYLRGQEAGLRLRENSTAFVGADLPEQPSALLKFLCISDFLRRKAGRAVLDDAFSLFDDLDTTHIEPIELRPGVTVFDGATRFDRYSRLRWLALQLP